MSKARTRQLEVSDTQPFPGWGSICIECNHVFEDKKKYIEPFSPTFPCRNMKFAGCQPVFDLVRYVDGSESCPRFEPSERLKSLRAKLDDVESESKGEVDDSI